MELLRSHLTDHSLSVRKACVTALVALNAEIDLLLDKIGEVFSHRDRAWAAKKVASMPSFNERFEKRRSPNESKGAEKELKEVTKRVDGVKLTDSKTSVMKRQIVTKDGVNKSIDESMREVPKDAIIKCAILMRLSSLRV